MEVSCNKNFTIKLTEEEARHIVEYVNELYPKYIKEDKVIPENFLFLMNLKDELVRSLS